MKDPGNKVADLYDAKRTPEVYVVGSDGKLLYHGRIDENYEEPTKVTSPDLKNALDADPRRPARLQGGDEGLRLHDQACLSRSRHLVGFGGRPRPPSSF